MSSSYKPYKHGSQNNKKPRQQAQQKQVYVEHPSHMEHREVSQEDVNKSITASSTERVVVINVPPGYPELEKLSKQHRKLEKTIRNFTKRLTSLYSEPLQNYRDALLKEDLGILTKMTDQLVKIPSPPAPG